MGKNSFSRTSREIGETNFGSEKTVCRDRTAGENKRGLRREINLRRERDFFDQLRGKKTDRSRQNEDFTAPRGTPGVTFLGKGYNERSGVTCFKEGGRIGETGETTSEVRDYIGTKKMGSRSHQKMERGKWALLKKVVLIQKWEYIRGFLFDRTCLGRLGSEKVNSVLQANAGMG